MSNRTNFIPRFHLKTAIVVLIIASGLVGLNVFAAPNGDAGWPYPSFTWNAQHVEAAQSGAFDFSTSIFFGAVVNPSRVFKDLAIAITIIALVAFIVETLFWTPKDGNASRKLFHVNLGTIIVLSCAGIVFVLLNVLPEPSPIREPAAYYGWPIPVFHKFPRAGNSDDPWALRTLGPFGGKTYLPNRMYLDYMLIDFIICISILFILGVSCELLIRIRTGTT